MAIGLDDAVGITAIVGTAIAIYELGHNITTQALADQIGSRNTKIAKRIAQLMSKDEQLRNSLTQAYNNRNTKLMNSLLLQNPVGASFNNIRTKIDKTDKEYADEINKIIARNAQYQAIQNQSQDAYVRAGQSSYNYLDADKVSKDASKKLAELEDSAANQAMNGGLQTQEGDNK